MLRLVVEVNGHSFRDDSLHKSVLISDDAKVLSIQMEN
jgi:hypothetical protein